MGGHSALAPSYKSNHSQESGILILGVRRFARDSPDPFVFEFGASMNNPTHREPNHDDDYGTRTNSKSGPRETGKADPPLNRFALRTGGLREINFCAAPLSPHADHFV